MDRTEQYILVQRLSAATSRCHEWCIKHERKIIWAGICGFVAIFTAIGAWKLWSFGYNALDLAIYRQVAEHSLRGDLFGFSFHPHKYLGDHLSFLYAALWPVYVLWKQPITLVFLQNLALALTVIPLAKVSARIVGRPWHLLFVFAYLANPIIQNMALFEFHMLPFAIFILSWTILAYVEQKYRRYLLLLALSLLVREDVSLPVIGLGLLAAVERRSWRWILPPILLGVSWFLLALKLTTYFSGYENYKYLVYYGWLGDSLTAMARTIVTQPWVVVAHVMRFTTASLALVLLAPFAFLPLLRGRWLVPILPILPQLLLASSVSPVVIQIHYPSLLLPFFFVATIAAWQTIRQVTGAGRGLLASLHRNWPTVTIIFVAVTIYSSLSLGPLPQTILEIAKTKTISDRVRLERAMIKSLPPGGVASSLESLVAMSDRFSSYSLHYIFRGRKQFSQEPYVLPVDAVNIFMDQRDFLFYQVLYPPDSDDALNGYRRIRELLADRGFVLTRTLDRFSVFQRQPGQSGLEQLYSTGRPAAVNGRPTAHGGLEFVGWSAPDGRLQTVSESVGNQPFRVLPFSLTFAKKTADKSLYQLELSFRRGDKVMHQIMLTLSGGLYPTSDWPAGTAVTSHYRLSLPGWLDGQTSITVRVMDLAGGLGLNGPRSSILFYTKYRPVGPDIQLGMVDL